MKIKYNTLSQKEVVSLNMEETLILRRFKPTKIQRGSKDSKLMIMFCNALASLLFKILMINYIVYSKDGDVKIHILFRLKKLKQIFSDAIEYDIRRLIELKNQKYKI